MNINKIFLLMIVFILQCSFLSDFRNIQNFIDFDCESQRFYAFRLYRSFDKNRICVYSPRKELIEQFYKKNHNQVQLLYPFPSEQIMTGLELAKLNHFDFLSGNFALFTNATGVDQNLNGILELLIQNHKKPDLLLAPEHGIFSAEDNIFNRTILYEKNYHIPILNLYSKIKKPPLKYLKDIDTILIDIQNLPVRCYTYVSTLTYLLEAADILQKEVIILDRPHPYGIWQPMGPYLQEEFRSFVGEAPVPFLYSMTPAEYSIFMAIFKFKHIKLKIIRMENFEPQNIDWTLANTWINPSPNIPDMETALIYVGMVFFEGTNISLGRGTTKPFIYSGAPWLNHRKVLQELRKLNLKGVRFGLVEFRPSSSLYKGKLCKGIQIHPVSIDFNPIRVGYEYMKLIKKIHPNRFYFKKTKGKYFIDKLWGSDSYRKSIEEHLEYHEFEKLWISESKHFYWFTKELKIYP